MRKKKTEKPIRARNILKKARAMAKTKEERREQIRAYLAERNAASKDHVSMRAPGNLDPVVSSRGILGSFSPNNSVPDPIVDGGNGKSTGLGSTDWNEDTKYNPEEQPYGSPKFKFKSKTDALSKGSGITAAGTEFEEDKLPVAPAPNEWTGGGTATPLPGDGKPLGQEIEGPPSLSGISGIGGSALPTGGVGGIISPEGNGPTPIDSSGLMDIEGITSGVLPQPAAPAETPKQQQFKSAVLVALQSIGNPEISREDGVDSPLLQQLFNALPAAEQDEVRRYGVGILYDIIEEQSGDIVDNDLYGPDDGMRPSAPKPTNGYQSYDTMDAWRQNQMLGPGL